jgi:hypothetical protein
MAVTVVPTVVPSRRPHRWLTAPAQAAAPTFLLVAEALSVVNHSSLRAWNWAPLDHHGVPWPSSLALLPGGWLQTLAFCGAGTSLLALAVALPRDGRSRLLASCGAGLLAAAFPLDLPDGAPGDLGSWIHSWHAVVHTGGFAVAGLAGLLAIAASRQRADVALAVVLASAVAVGGTPGWYAFLAGFFAWIWCVARRAAGDEAAPRSGSGWLRSLRGRRSVRRHLGE